MAVYNRRRCPLLCAFRPAVAREAEVAGRHLAGFTAFGADPDASHRATASARNASVSAAGRSSRGSLTCRFCHPAGLASGGTTHRPLLTNVRLAAVRGAGAAKSVAPEPVDFNQIVFTFPS